MAGCQVDLAEGFFLHVKDLDSGSGETVGRTGALDTFFDSKTAIHNPVRPVFLGESDGEDLTLQATDETLEANFVDVINF